MVKMNACGVVLITNIYIGELDFIRSRSDYTRLKIDVMCFKQKHNILLQELYLYAVQLTAQDFWVVER